ncbi:Peptidase-like protein [Leptotrombidium deliense]|uniref:Peptidase-like protein n=1 Tax=Leptotrombidium deliense TaxID=299467 RepID=A0A443RVR5_9ACAR|nr:Peptidase-like protein [Leptotrombidium deliense]
MWWSNETWEVYQKKVKCFVDQYNEFTEPVTGEKVNGTLTTGENIADNGGIFQSFVAYKLYASLSKPELDKKLPSPMSKYTKDQIFYIAFANTYCNNDSPDYLRYQLKKDVHSPFYARVIVPLQNSEHFSQTFQCSKGSRMNPNEKCVLW